MEFNIQSVTIKELAKCFKPEEVFGYCARCPKYGKIWSCPEHDFDVEAYVNKYRDAHIIGIKVYIDESYDKDKATELFHKSRSAVSLKLLEIEKQYPDSEVLYAGNCHFCEECTRKDGLPCVSPDKLRYSLEALGYKVSEVCKNVLKDEIQWFKDGGTPEYMLSVAAIFSNDEMDLAAVKAQLER